MSLSDMAREIERRRPGTLDELLNDDLTITYHDHAKFLSDSTERAFHLPDPLAAAILRDAMVMAAKAGRGIGKWDVTVEVLDNMGRSFLAVRDFYDRDHGNDSTRSLFAAFCAAYPEVKP